MEYYEHVAAFIPCDASRAILEGVRPSNHDDGALEQFTDGRVPSRSTLPFSRLFR